MRLIIDHSLRGHLILYHLEVSRVFRTNLYTNFDLDFKSFTRMIMI